MTRVATTPSTDPDEALVGPSDGLPEELLNLDEFSDNADPKGDACCYEPRCPCHGSDE